MRQTDGYTDETQLPIYEAIKGLPRLLDHTQIRAQIPGAAGQNVAKAGAASEGKEHAETPVNGGFCHALAHAGAMREMERAKGFESVRGAVAHAMMCKNGPIYASRDARQPARCCTDPRDFYRKLSQKSDAGSQVSWQRIAKRSGLLFGNDSSRISRIGLGSGPARSDQTTL
jgi:hypothetical protein